MQQLYGRGSVIQFLRSKIGAAFFSRSFKFPIVTKIKR
jgi:hypothetical protein